MDFVRYAEQCADLLNSSVETLEELKAHLAGRDDLNPTNSPTERDVAQLRAFHGQVRPIFAAGTAGDVSLVVATLNTLMGKHPITPFSSDHDAHDLHLHVTPNSASVAHQLISESLLGLATLVCELGATRLGLCADEKCARVFVDTSPNQSRRYCSDRCSSRANVAAYRARKKAANHQPGLA